MPSYDGRIEWEPFYRARIQRAKVSGSTLTGLCPFHNNTKTAAFSADLKTGKCKCHGCDFTGNATTFLAKLDGITSAEANRVLCEIAGVSADDRPKKATSGAPYTVETYAAEKHLDAARLTEWGVTSRRYGGKSWVEMTYRDTAGNVSATRKRFSPDAAQRFAWAKGSTLIPYGAWLIPSWRDSQTSTVALVEGESDCHALWSLGIAALGIPGAGTFKAEWVPMIDGFDVALHSEGDDGAKLFASKVASALCEARFSGTMAVWESPGEFKDPSEVYKAAGQGAADAIGEALRAAVPLDFAQCPAALVGDGHLAAAGLLCPDGYLLRDGQLYAEGKEGDVYFVTATPPLITRRIIDAGGSGERIELTFHRDGKHRSVVADRDEAFSTRSIVSLLAPLGAHVTSENAKHIVRWLGALEAVNFDRLDKATASSALGWCGEAFLPVDCGEVVLDVDESSAEMVAAFKASGDRAAWLALIGKAREESPVCRFMVASAFAAPLLRATRGRILFVYNWGASKGGKTAGVKAALSVWGDPDALMTTFNATAVGLERLASFMRDLPLGIDERQIAGRNQERIDSMVFQLASGTGRVRGAKDGGLQATSHWRSMILATGEEPMSGSTSTTGVSTRVLEVYGAPFLSEADAAAMHAGVAEHHGHAGADYIAHIKALGDAAVVRMHGEVMARLQSYASTRASSHLSGVALVTVADMIASRLFWGADERWAEIDALGMAASVLESLDDAASGDVDEAACQWLEGWLRSNDGRFDSGTFGPVYGDVSGDTYRVLVPVLRESIEAAGFSYKKTLRALASRGAIASEKGASTVARIHGKSSRVIAVDVSVLLGQRSGAEATIPF